MRDIVIDVENISKLYSLRQVGTGTLGRDLSRWWTTTVLRKADPYLEIGEVNRRDQKGTTDIVRALNDVSFKVEQGDVIGIIGKNGSGKSTLLKIISRITTPTTGIVRAKGRVASLLEVGTGFHPDLTGRDNVFMNGAILGMTRSEIKNKFDEIVEFSGVERYIDTPVKRYSSGMKVRLGFAVAAFLEPEILVVDEVLAVGDAAFQRYAIGKMQNIACERGRTVIFVSHNMNSVLQLCSRGIILEDGNMIYDGTSQEAVTKYISALGSQISFEGIDGDPEILALTRCVVDSADGKNGVFVNSSPLEIKMEIQVTKKINSLVIGFNLISQYEYPVARADYNDFNKLTSLPPGVYKFTFRIPPHTLAPGTYRVAFDVAERNAVCYTTEKSELTFDVISGEDKFGYVFPDVTPKKMSLIHSEWFVDFEKIS